MSGAILTAGLGQFGSASLVLTIGLGPESTPPPAYGSPDEYLTLTTWSDPDPSLATTEAYDPAADDGGADASLTLTTWE